MSYTNISQALDAMHDLERNLSAYNHAMGVLYLDASTAAPKDSFEGRGQTMAVLTQASYDLLANPQNEELFRKSLPIYLYTLKPFFPWLIQVIVSLGSWDLTHLS